MKDPTLEALSRRPRAGRPPSPPRRRLEPLELSRWVEERSERIGEWWLSEVRARGTQWDGPVEAMMERFVKLMVGMVPTTLGPFREQGETLWAQTAELFGSVAAKRGLAAGEAIEEFQLLREGLIRLLLEEPFGHPIGPPLSRDLLRLNRVVDMGVTYASVGHTDALFFALFQGSGVAETLEAPLVAEVNDQLDAIRDELRDLGVGEEAGGP